MDAGIDLGAGLSNCAAHKYTGELLPLDMFVMLDRSASMQNSGKWSAVTGALGSFVKLPGLSGISMGMGFFPTKPAVPMPDTCLSDADCGVYGPCQAGLYTCSSSNAPDDSCVDTDYAKPVVGIAPLPGVATAITSAMGAQRPEGASTPTDAAEHGALEYATQWARAHPRDITIVVLATDGEPTNCESNTIQTVAARAAKGYSGKPPVKTFVIGVGSSLGNLDAIANSGGTGKALIVSAGNAGHEFLDALDKIRGAVGCRLEIPKPQNGKTPDYSQVNVTFTPDGGSQQIFKQSSTGKASGCQGNRKWYYDDPQNPTHIVLCPSSCNLISNTKGETDVYVGCKTIVQ